MDDNKLFGQNEDESNDTRNGDQVRFQDIFDSIKKENRKPNEVTSDKDAGDTGSQEVKEEKAPFAKENPKETESKPFDFKKFEDRSDKSREERRNVRKDRRDHDGGGKEHRRDDDRGDRKWSDQREKPRGESRWGQNDRDSRPFDNRTRSPRRSRPEREDRGRDTDGLENRDSQNRDFNSKEEYRAEDRIKARRVKSTRTETFDKFASFYLGESNADYRKKIQEKEREENNNTERRTTRRERPGGNDDVAETNIDTPVKRERTTREMHTPGVMRLNKYIAKSGLCSRRKAAELVKAGEITVNDVVEVQPAYEVQDGDVIMHQGEVLQIQDKMVYLLLNKPKNFITTLDDEQDRRTVMELVENKTDVRIYPVGRLDRNTTGLLLFTNDGDLAKKLSHPSYKVQKFYQVTLDRDVTQEDIDAIAAGLTLEDGIAPVDAVGYIEGGGENEVGIEIHIGKNRIVRRIFESLGYRVERLDRTYYAGLTKKDLSRGWSRHLTHKEIIMLKHFSKK